MPTLRIGDQQLQLGDEFLKLSPEKQKATISEIASQLNKTQSAKPAAAAMGAEFLKGIPGGIAKGLEGFAETSRKLTGAPDTMQGDPIGQAVAGGFQKVKGALPQGQGRAGQFGETVGEFVGNPISYAGPGGIAAKAATATTSALGSEALSQLLTGTGAEPYAALIGATIGGGLPAKALSPVKAIPGREKAVSALRKERVEPTAGDVTGSRGLKIAEATLGEVPGAGGKYTEARKRIGDEYTRAALARIGETATEASPEVMDRFFVRSGRQFDALAARNKAPYNTTEGQKYVRDLYDAVDKYAYLFDGETKPKVDYIFNRVMNNLVRGGELAGDQYKTLRSETERIRRNNVKDPELNQFLGTVRDAMDSFMEGSIAKNNPADLGAWKEVRRQYRNALVLENVSTGAGELAASGEVTPAKLRQAVRSQNKREYARGRGDFAGLARAGEEVLGRPGTSLTSERGWLHAVPATAGAVGGTLLTGSPMEGGLAALGGLAAPALAGRALMSPAMQWYLKNQLGGPLRGGGRRGLAAESEIEYGGPQQ